MLNKKNAACAVIGFALVGCNNILGACDCCKSVPQALERFTLILKNLKGITYKTVGDYFNNNNIDKEKEYTGKELVAKGIAKANEDVDAVAFYIVEIDVNKGDMKVYKKPDDEVNMKKESVNKKCKLVKIIFDEVGANDGHIADDANRKYKVNSITTEAESTITT